MAAISKVTQSYQVTIPSKILEKAGIGIGTILTFELREDGILLRPQDNLEDITTPLPPFRRGSIISPQDSFRQTWKEIQAGETLPVETLWDGIDAE